MWQTGNLTGCTVPMTWSMLGLAAAPCNAGQDKQFRKWMNGSLHNNADTCCGHCGRQRYFHFGRFQCRTIYSNPKMFADHTDSLFCVLTMFSCGRCSGTCGPPGRTYCCWVPCIPRGWTHCRWPHRTRCCGRNLPGPRHPPQAQPATS